MRHLSDNNPTGMESVIELTDEQLIQQIVSTGDKKGFALLYKRYAHLLLGWCLRYLKDQEASEDAVMDIMEQLIQNLHRYKIKDFKNWLFLVTRNHCFMKLRAKASTLYDDLSNVGEDDFVENDEDSPLIIEKQELLLHEAIEKLDEEQRICIVLFYFKKLSYKEIVDSTGYEAKKVKSYIQNGKRNLRIALQDRLSGDLIG